MTTSKEEKKLEQDCNRTENKGDCQSIPRFHVQSITYTLFTDPLRIDSSPPMGSLGLL